MEIPPEVSAFYGQGTEAGRLDREFRLEQARTRELLTRHLPPVPAVILDVGGAAGAHALWLAARGYEVHLVDPVPLHVEQARGASAAQPAPLASVRQGEARSLEQPRASVDVVLLLGPLYHLLRRGERLAALREARRVLRPGGLLFAAAISRFASLLDGLRGALFADPDFERIVEKDLRDGQHRNPTGRPQYFTSAFFHRPEELRSEVRAAGLILDDLVALEGPGAFLHDFDLLWDDPRRRDTLLRFVRAVEREPSLLGLGPHLLAVAHRPRASRSASRRGSKRRADTPRARQRVRRTG
ncbi:MAG TPA: methyltransferase domain-containing protein [Vicinamibacteria bacterium]|nr:methyltransferase domain-containing protein [Vicinamibacteria bacterium]